MSFGTLVWGDEVEWRDEETLRELYVDEELIASEIADRFDVTTTAITNELRSSGLVEGDPEVCPDCGKEYLVLMQHIRLTSCDIPEMPSRLVEMVTGLLMGDGWFRSNSEGCRGSVSVAMVSQPFLEWLDDSLGIYSNGVRPYRSATDGAESARRSGLNPDAIADNYRDMYALNVKCATEIQHLGEWCAPKKRYPEDLELTPEMARMWYVCDGSLKWSNSNSVSALISCCNEADRPELLKSLFQPHGFDPYVDDNGTVRFSTSETREFLDWIGRAPPGFAYKWEVDDYRRYKRLIG